MATVLTPKIVEKPWGRTDLAGRYGIDGNYNGRIGEIWFEDPEGKDHDLLIKLLFTSERLSVQVHPDDAAAHVSGHARGKDEAWCVIEAGPEAVIGLGLKAAVSATELERSARDGTIVDLMDWRSVHGGDIYYSPAGTIHAIGAGLVLLEIQQNLDLTYRLFDFGRPRELHLDQGIAVSVAEPYICPASSVIVSPGHVTHRGAKFTVESLQGAMKGLVKGSPNNSIWIIVGEASCQVNNVDLAPWSVVLCDRESELMLPRGANAFAAYSSPDVGFEAIVQLFINQGQEL